MFKLVITDPHLLPCELLIETGGYLLQLASALSTTKDAFPELAPTVNLSEPDPRYQVEPDFPSPSKPMANYLLANAPEKIVDKPKSPLVEIGLDHLDSAGLPWDSRVHTRTKSKNEDGTWKTQRNIPSAKQLTQKKTVEIPVPPAPPLIPVTPVPADPIEPEVLDFNSFIGKISKLIASGKINHLDVRKACENAGVPSLPLVSTRPDLIPQISAAIDVIAGGMA